MERAEGQREKWRERRNRERDGESRGTEGEMERTEGQRERWRERRDRGRDGESGGTEGEMELAFK